MQPQYVGFWTRFVAALFDGIILWIFSIIMRFVFGFFYGLVAGNGQDFESIAFILQVVIAWLYYASLESSEQQATIGKQALGIIVTDLEGNKISFARATGRYFAKWISTFILFIGYILAAFTQKKQALHDIIAATLVVNK